MEEDNDDEIGGRSSILEYERGTSNNSESKILPS